MFIFEEAERLLTTDRQDSYGNPDETARRVGMVWAGILGRGEPIPPHQVHAMMACLKLVRGVRNPTHMDSWIDGVAYTALAYKSVDSQT